jgi:hypothetical protein
MRTTKRIVAGSLVMFAAMMSSGCDLLEAIPPELSDIPTSELIAELLSRGYESVLGDDE